MKKKKKKQIMIKKMKYMNKIEKEKTDKNEKEKGIAEPKQNELPLKSIVVYHDTKQDGEMESNKGCPTIKTKNIFIYILQLTFCSLDNFIGY